MISCDFCSSLSDNVGHGVGSSGPDIKKHEEWQNIRQAFQNDSECFMLNTLAMEFPQVENEEAKGT